MTPKDDPQLTTDRLSLVYEISQTFNSSLDIEEVLDKVIDGVITATNAERGFVMLREEDGSLVFKTARGIDQTTIEKPEFEISRSVVAKVAESGEALLCSDAQSDLSSSISVVNLNLRSILCTPLIHKDNTLGVVYVDNRIQKNIFGQDDLNLLNSIASNAAIAIENARLYQVAIEKGRMEKELQVANKVQSSLIPQEVPDIPGWEFAAYWVPAREVAGDFYDFIYRKNNHTGMVIADVVDKGMAAALFMAYSRSVLRANFSQDSSPKKAITDTNHTIATDSAYGMFLTLTYLEVAQDSNELTYVNAGHNPPLLFHKRKNKPTPLTRTGMLIGVDETAAYEQELLQLETGDFIVFFTDGVTEAINAMDEEYGDERLQTTIRNNKKESAEKILAAIIKSVGEFCGSTPQFDDTTLVVVKKV